MTSDAAIRERIIVAATELFAVQGYNATKVQMVAKAAGVSAHTVRRLTGKRAELFRLVMARQSSTVAQRFEQAVQDPLDRPPLSVVLAAAAEVFAAPDHSWSLLELEALTRAHRDPDLLEIESARIAGRGQNTRVLIDRIRASGGLDEEVDEAAVVLLAMTLSVGLAMLAPTLPNWPTLANWNALMARISTALAPAEIEPALDVGPGTPWRVRVDVRARPGDLARLIRALASLQVHTVAVQVIDAEDGYRTILLIVTAPQSATADQIRAAAGSVGRNVYVVPGDREDELDIPVHVLNGAVRLVDNPGWAPIGARILAAADRVEVVPATQGADAGPEVMRLQWTPTRHVVLHRTGMPFTRTDRNRISALLRLSSAIAEVRGDERAKGWLQPIKDGTVWIRLARPEDSDGVAEMHAQCSERTRYLRYVSCGQWREIQMQRLSGGHRGATLVAIDELGSVVALGNVFPESDDQPGVAEIAIIVRDDFQGRGLGTGMLRHQIELARVLGFAEVVAVVLAENLSMLHLLESTALDWTSSILAGVATWRAPLTGLEILPGTDATNWVATPLLVPVPVPPESLGGTRGATPSGKSAATGAAPSASGKSTGTTAAARASGKSTGTATAKSTSTAKKARPAGPGTAARASGKSTSPATAKTTSTAKKATGKSTSTAKKARPAEPGTAARASGKSTSPATAKTTSTAKKATANKATGKSTSTAKNARPAESAPKRPGPNDPTSLQE